MSVIIATKTLKLIEDSIASDGANAFRQNLGVVLPHIGDAYREGNDGFRSHLGASLIGGECGRAIWYGFRWFQKSKFSGRLLRLFNRGHLEEGRFIAILLSVGIHVYQQDENGNQFRISDFGGHFGGSGDGIAIGFPELPEGSYALLEFKTHNDKSFQKLKKEGVKKAKPEHFIQMQMYLHKMGLFYAMYMAVNKNDDEIYAEIVVIDKYTAPQFLDRAEKLIFSVAAPDRINENSSWYQCKYCDYADICHKGALPEMNCRSCIYSNPQRDGIWYCRLKDCSLDKQAQLNGCDQYSAL